ncbi:MAG: hypothetical protein IPI67_30780 [Myxococcales bacterium]|nr:hypothetical protein [Myxococcales bacterium]
MGQRYCLQLRVLVALAVALAGCSSTSPRDEEGRAPVGELGMNDVSMLFPLPAPGHLDELWSANTVGRFGALLPVSVFSQAPCLTPGCEQDSDYDRLRVVAARVDPCFPSLTLAPSPACRFQVRLVLQPVDESPGQVVTEDTAIHLFYDLPVGDFVSLIADLLAAQRGSLPLAADQPLGPHPTLLAEGLSGAYSVGLKGALSAVIGADRLTRVTFMRRGTAADSWTFAGYDLVHGAVIPVAILDPKVTEQSFVNDVAAGALGFAARLEPANLPTPEDLGPVFDSVSAKQLDDDSLWPSYEAALRIENPELHSPASVDCVSCHAAQPARFWMERNTALGNRFSASRYTSTQPLEVVSAIDDTTRVLRAFGWFQARPAISARVVNESAAVVAYLNQRLLQ